MMEILDPTLVAEFSAAVLAFTQWAKVRPLFKKLDGEGLALLIGLVIGLGYYILKGDVFQSLSWGGIDWGDAFRGAVNGMIGGIAASTGFNIQKYLPIPNVLPTRAEKGISESQRAATTDMPSAPEEGAVG